MSVLWLSITTHGQTHNHPAAYIHKDYNVLNYYFLWTPRDFFQILDIIQYTYMRA